MEPRHPTSDLTPPGSPIRVLIADDDPRLLALLRNAIASEPGLEIVAEVETAEGIGPVAARTRPDVAVLDVVMPGGGGAHAARRIRELSPETRIIGFSGSDQRHALIEMLTAGAIGYVLKGDDLTELVRSIEEAARGGVVVSGHVVAEAVGELVRRLRSDADATAQVNRLRSDVESFIDGGLRIVFQPIVRLPGGRPWAVEALSRFGTGADAAPTRWFAAAWEVGLGPELELAAVRAATQAVMSFRGDALLSVNLSPETLLTTDLDPYLGDVPPDHLVIEVTEHAPVHDYEAFRSTVRRLRDRGAKLAIDDAGSGFASLRHILELDPDVIKLDVSITQGIDVDVARQRMAAALISFAAHGGSLLVAEGVETPGHARALRDLGVRLMQGYHVGRPGPLEAIRQPSVRAV